MKMQEVVKEKVSFWLEWRSMGNAYYATMQIEEADSVASRNPSCVKRVKLTKEEANMPLTDLMNRYPRLDITLVNYERRVVMPVYRYGKKVFAIAIYGLTRADISGRDGYEPFEIVLKRMGLDTTRYQISPHDVFECESHNYQPPENTRK